MNFWVDDTLITLKVKDLIEMELRFRHYREIWGIWRGQIGT